MSAPEHEGQVRPFADFLREQARGTTHDELSEALNELVGAVVETRKGGTLTLVIKVKPAGRGMDGTVVVTDDIKVKLPEGERPEAIFFVDDDNNLTRYNPAQQHFPLREVERTETFHREDDPEPDEESEAGDA